MTMLKLTKPTPAEWAAYDAATRDGMRAHLYPLFGWVTVDGHRLAVEDLSMWDREDPQYEVIAPEGMSFGGDEQLHTLLAHTQKDLRERLASYPLAPCACEGCATLTGAKLTDATLTATKEG